TFSAGDVSAVSETSPPKSTPSHSCSNGTCGTSMRDQISSAFEPLGVHGDDGLSTVSTFDMFGTSSTLIRAKTGRDTDGSHDSSLLTLTFSVTCPMPVNPRSTSNSISTSVLLNGAIRLIRADAPCLNTTPAVVVVIDTVVLSISTAPPFRTG